MAEEIIFTVNDTQETVSLFVDEGGVGITSFNGRTTPAVVPTIGDYTTAQVTEDINLYYTDDRVEANGVVVSNTSKITTSRFEARCLGQAVNGRIENYTSALANIALKESTASLLFDAKICGVGDEKLFNLLPFDIYKDFTVSRNGTATYIGSDGFIKTALANVPRIDYTDSVNPALLVEPQGTNLLTYSEDFSEDTAWLKALITVTSNNTVSPDGTNNADKLESTGTGSLRTNNAIAFVDDYSYSVFVKKGNSRYITLRSAFFTTNINVGFDLDTATSETGGVIEVFDNDWFRLSISKDISLDADKSGYFYTYFPSSLGGQTSVSGNYFYMWGCNVEDSAVASSYIPTEGTTVTRVADVVTVSPPTGTTSITETINGVNQTPITNIPTTYTVPVYNLGAEKLTDPSFNNGLDDWSSGTVTETEGTVYYNNNNDYISQNISFTNGKVYSVKTKGEGQLRIRTGYAGTDANIVHIQATGEYIFTATSDSNRVQIYGSTIDPIASLDSVELKEVLSAGVRMNKITMT